MPDLNVLVKALQAGIASLEKCMNYDMERDSGDGYWDEAEEPDEEDGFGLQVLKQMRSALREAVPTGLTRDQLEWLKALAQNPKAEIYNYTYTGSTFTLWDPPKGEVKISAMRCVQLIRLGLLASLEPNQHMPTPITITVTGRLVAAFYEEDEKK
jgi:hypothetical protein